MNSLVFQNLFPFAAVGVFLFIVIASGYSSTKRQKQAMRLLSAPFNGSCSWSLFSCSFNGRYQGIEFFITYSPQSKNTPAYLKISLKKQTQLKLRISPESLVSRFGEKIGIVHEVKTRDESFDKDFLIFSNQSEQAAIYLSSHDKKNGVRELFNHGFDSLIIDGKRILIQKPYPDKDYSVEDLSLQKVKEILDLLFKLTIGI
jgi:hypothetical protein